MNKNLKYYLFFNKEYSEEKYQEAKKLITSLFPKAVVTKEHDEIGLIEYSVGKEKIQIDNDGELDEVTISSTFDLQLKGYKTFTNN